MDRWGDYWRFTDLSIRKLMESVFGEGNVEIVTFGNALAATAFLQGLAIDDLPDTSLLDKKDLDYQITIGIKVLNAEKIITIYIRSFNLFIISRFCYIGESTFFLV